MSSARERVRKRLLELAADDEVVVAAANTGSYVSGSGDEWSDIDLAFSIRGELAPALDRSRHRVVPRGGVRAPWSELADCLR